MDSILTWDTASFNATLAEVARRSNRTASETVVLWARRLTQKAAYSAPKAAEKFFNDGRLRAGFWPAILALGGHSAYTPAPNKGEGAVELRGMGTDHPEVMIENNVPYILNLAVGVSWFGDAVASVQARMESDLDQAYQKVVAV